MMCLCLVYPDGATGDYDDMIIVIRGLIPKPFRGTVRMITYDIKLGVLHLKLWKSPRAKHFARKFSGHFSAPVTLVTLDREGCLGHIFANLLGKCHSSPSCRENSLRSELGAHIEQAI